MRASARGADGRAALRQNARRRRSARHFVAVAARCREIASLLNFLALLPRPLGLYPLNESNVPGGRRAAQARNAAEARAMALNHVTLDDKYDLDEEPDLRHRLPGDRAPAA